MPSPTDAEAGRREGRAPPADAGMLPFDWVSVGYMALLSVAILWKRADIPFASVHLGWHAGSILFTPLVLGLYRRWPSWLTRVIRYWYVAIAVAIAFFQSKELVPIIGGPDLDPQLMALDRAWFGSHPAHFIARWQRPWLTDVFGA